jgi:hypothetical protein
MLSWDIILILMKVLCSWTCSPYSSHENVCQLKLYEIGLHLSVYERIARWGQQAWLSTILPDCIQLKSHFRQKLCVSQNFMKENFHLIIHQGVMLWRMWGVNMHALMPHFVQNEIFCETYMAKIFIRVIWFRYSLRNPVQGPWLWIFITCFHIAFIFYFKWVPRIFQGG